MEQTKIGLSDAVMIEIIHSLKDVIMLLVEKMCQTDSTNYTPHTLH